MKVGSSTVDPVKAMNEADPEAAPGEDPEADPGVDPGAAWSSDLQHCRCFSLFVSGRLSQCSSRLTGEAGSCFFFLWQPQDT